MFDGAQGVVSSAPAEQGTRSIRTALFVDFDNIYLGLERESYEAARQFATNPMRWLDWLCEQRIENDPDYHQFHRRILIRRCYLNPNSFSRFRADFTRSAFHVVDCPPLTGGGKTSADIQMVLDILDTLQQETRIDEFMILSADADFTPVLSRLGRHDRRSIILAVGPASATYRASCDLLLDQDEFIDVLLGGKNEEGGGRAGPSVREPLNRDELLNQMAARLYDEATQHGPVLARDLARVYRSFPQFAASTDWLGHYGLRKLTEHLAALRAGLAIEDGGVDPSAWRVVTRGAAATARTAGPHSGGAVAPPLPPPAAEAQLAGEIVELLDHLVANSSIPIAMATAAGRLKHRFGRALDTWLGYQKFEEMLRNLPPGNFRLSEEHPRYLYDPARHVLPAGGGSAARADEIAATHPELMQLAKRVHQITDVPYLTPERYAMVFEEAAGEIARNGFNVMWTSKAVRDALMQRGTPVPRISITFILRGLSYMLSGLGEQPFSPSVLGEAFRDQVLDLCKTARLELTQDERDLLDRWLLAGLAPEQPEAGSPATGPLDNGADPAFDR